MAKNVFGWSEFSLESAIKAATLPDQMDPVVTTIVTGSKVRIAWTAPDDRGDTITSYQILIETSTAGTFYEDTTDCLGSDLTIVQNLYCEIPLSTLMDQAATNLVQGDLIVAKVTATNNYGTSTESLLNTEGALIETVPHKLSSAPTRVASTTESQIVLEFSPLLNEATGGSPILSYVVYWDQGLGGALSPILGDTSNNLDTTVTITSADITSGGVYIFTVLGRNEHGDGEQSDQVSILAATVPATMNPPTVSAVSQSLPLTYTVTVTAPYSGGAGVAIDSYQIEFLQSD